MMNWRYAWVPLTLVATAAGVEAAPSPGAVRIALDGQTHIVRTIGQPNDPDFYAPITKSLRSLMLDVQFGDLGDVEVRYQGNRVARWPVVSSRERLPADAREPVVLREGDELLVPVRAAAALANGWVDWDSKTRTLTITPTVRRIELKQGENGLEVRLEASAPVRVTHLQLTRPSRLAIDITPAWFKVEGPPRPVGVVRSARLGQFTRQTARLALELSGGAVQVTGLPQTGEKVTARLEAGSGDTIARASDPTDGGGGSGGAGSQPGSPPAARITVPGIASRAPLGRLSDRRGRALASRGGLVRRDPGVFGGEAVGPLAGKVICVDPGHGGWKSGASGQNGLKEGDACLGMALQLAAALRESGATVLSTREDDRYVSLEDRWGFANNQSVDLFISIHCNAMPRHGSQSGSETYYCTPQSLELARALHQEVVRVMGGRDGGIRRRNFAVVRHTTMPSVLLEVGYIDHPGDESKLGDPAFQSDFGKAVRDGVLHYFGN